MEYSLCMLSIDVTWNMSTFLSWKRFCFRVVDLRNSFYYMITTSYSCHINNISRSTACLLLGMLALGSVTVALF